MAVGAGGAMAPPDFGRSVNPASTRKGEADYAGHIRDHSSITSSKRWVGGIRKWQFW